MNPAGRHFLSYLSVGIFITVIDVAIVAAGVYLFGNTNPVVIIGNIIGYLIATYLSFVLNGKYTFKDNDLTFKKMMKLYVATSFGFGINTVIVLSMINFLPLNTEIGIIFSKIVAAVIIFFYNYLMCQRFVFARKEII
jgi:putative flippase GtrA